MRSKLILLAFSLAALSCSDGNGVFDTGPGPPAPWIWENPQPQGNDLGAVLALGDQQFVAGGANGLFVFGSRRGSFQVLDSGFESSTRALWGRSTSDFYAASVRGVSDRKLLHFDGSDFHEIELPENDPSPAGKCSLLYWVYDDVQGRGDGELWVCGSGGYLARRLDGVWSRIDRATTSDVTSLWLDPHGEMVLAGDTDWKLHVFDGENWAVESPQETGFDGAPLAILGNDPSELWVVTISQVFHRTDGEWISIRHGEGPQRAATLAPDGSLLVSSWPDRIDRYANGAWTNEYGSEDDHGYLEAIAAAPTGEVFAVGQGGLLVQRHSLGGWVNRTRESSQGQLHFGKFWQLSGGRLLAVSGFDPVVLVREDGSWRLEEVGENGYVAVGGDAEAALLVDLQGALVRFDGTSWQSLHAGFPSRLRDAWLAESGNAYALSEDEALWKSDGSGWSKLADVPYALKLWGRGDQDIYVVTATELLLYDGNELRVLYGFEPQFGRPYLLWGNGSGRIYVAGSGFGPCSASPRVLEWGEHGGLPIDPFRAVYSMVESPDGRIFAGSSAGTIYELSGGSWSVIDRGQVERNIVDMVMLGEDLWILGSGNEILRRSGFLSRPGG